MRRRILFACVLLLAIVSVAGFAQLKITAEYIWRYNPTMPTDNRIVDYYNKIIVGKTGVDATWSTALAAAGKTAEQAVSEWLAAGTTPEVISYSAIFQEATWQKAMKESDLWRTFDVASIKKLLPNYVARLAKYGVKVEDVLPFNEFEGKNVYIPMGFSFSQFPALKNLPEAKAAGQNYYSVGLKDDVLKMIFPKARTEAEQQALFAKQGSLSPKDITGDIPMKNLDDLYQYLKQVKALNLKVGEKPVIPAALSAQSEALGSIDWSLRTIIGYHWEWPIVFTNPPGFEGSKFLRWMDDYGVYLRWWNKLYNEGLLDPEIFVMKNDQYFAKVINGEYAVVNFWAPIADARKHGQQSDPKYGYRFFPLFYGGLKPIFNNQTAYMSLAASPLVITKKVSDADLPKVMKWVDWYFTDEHDLLSFWGSPDMYTGTGKDRRYKAGYNDLVNWTVYGQMGGKDGIYYGLQRSYMWTPTEYEQVKMPLGGIFFFNAGQTYPEAPYYVYPKDKAKILALTDLWKYSGDVMYRTVWDDYKTWTYAIAPNRMVERFPEYSDWDQYQTDHSAEFSATVVKMVTGPVKDFDKNWANYLRLYGEAGTAALEQHAIQFMKDYYKNTILPKQIKMQ